MHILPYISRSKGNQAMKFGQLIGYNMTNISVEESMQNVLGKLFPDPYLEHQNWGYLWINIVNF